MTMFRMIDYGNGTQLVQIVSEAKKPGGMMVCRRFISSDGKWASKLSNGVHIPRLCKIKDVDPRWGREVSKVLALGIVTEAATQLANYRITRWSEGDADRVAEYIALAAAQIEETKGM